MRKILFLFISIGVLAACASKTNREKNASADPESGLKGNIQLSGAFALYPIVVKWSEAFKTLHPNVQIDISGGGAGKGITDVLSGIVDIGMVSREIYPEEIGKGAFPIAVARDAVVPTVNSRNPHLPEILRTGLKKETAEKVWRQEVATWGQLLGTSAITPVHVYTRSDACGAAETFASWFGKNQESLKGTAIFGDPGIAAAIQKDLVGVGYNNIAYVYDQKTKRPFEGLTVVPIDVNGNGRIDPEEDFYGTTETIIKAVHANRFPFPPGRELYLVTKGKPVKPEIIAFLGYILSEGQKYNLETGYISLSGERLKSEKEKLN